MARVFITGSTTGLGWLAARKLLQDGHEVVLHVRNADRRVGMAELARRAVAVAIGDLASADETRRLADQVNEIGAVDAVIHNAGTYNEQQRNATPEGHARTLAVNVLAPYQLTAWIERPSRLVWLSSGMDRGGDSSLQDIDWAVRKWNGTQAYRDSKLFLTALAFAVARRWTGVLSNVVNPGWVPTRMGGAGAPDDLEEGYLTQTWLAVSEEREAKVSGSYWYHRKRQTPPAASLDEGFQDALLNELSRLTGVSLP